MPPESSKLRARSATRYTLASTWCPAGRRANPACARVASSSAVTVSAIGRRLRARWRSASIRSASARSDNSGAAVSGIRWKGCSRPTSWRKRSIKLSGIANSDPFSAAKTDSSSSGHSMALSAARSASTSSRLWKDLEPTSRCGISRASRLLTYSRVMSAPKFVNRRNRMQTCRCDSGTNVAGSSGSRTFHPLSRMSHSTNATIAPGRHSLIASFDTRVLPYGRGTGSAMTFG